MRRLLLRSFVALAPLALLFDCVGDDATPLDAGSDGSVDAQPGDGGPSDVTPADGSSDGEPGAPLTGAFSSALVLPDTTLASSGPAVTSSGDVVFGGNLSPYIFGASGICQFIPGDTATHFPATSPARGRARRGFRCSKSGSAGSRDSVDERSPARAKPSPIARFDLPTSLSTFAETRRNEWKRSGDELLGATPDAGRSK